MANNLLHIFQRILLECQRCLSSSTFCLYSKSNAFFPGIECIAQDSFGWMNCWKMRETCQMTSQTMTFDALWRYYFRSINFICIYSPTLISTDFSFFFCIFPYEIQNHVKSRKTDLILNLVSFHVWLFFPQKQKIAILLMWNVSIFDGIENRRKLSEEL